MRTILDANSRPNCRFDILSNPEFLRLFSFLTSSILLNNPRAPLGITEDDLIVALRQLPSLSSLSYTSFFRLPLLADETMIFLTHDLDHDSANCLPNLTRFMYSGPIDFEPQHMITMLKSRIRHSESQADASAPLKKLLSFKIGYCNKDWAQDQDPNKIRDFHQEVIALGAQGPVVDISWGKQYEYR